MRKSYVYEKGKEIKTILRQYTTEISNSEKIAQDFPLLNIIIFLIIKRHPLTGIFHRHTFMLDILLFWRHTKNYGQRYDASKCFSYNRIWY